MAHGVATPFIDVAKEVLPLSNITVDRLRHISGRRRSADSFVGATKWPDALTEPTIKNGYGWQTNRTFHGIDCAGATFIFFSGIPISRGTNTSVNANEAQGNIVSRYTVPNSVAPGYLAGGFGTSAYVIDPAAHDFSFTLDPHEVWLCGFSSRVVGPCNWFGILGSTLFSGEASPSSTWRGARLTSG
jgi:hypothetical protein